MDKKGSAIISSKDRSLMPSRATLKVYDGTREVNRRALGRPLALAKGRSSVWLSLAPFAVRPADPCDAGRRRIGNLMGAGAPDVSTQMKKASR